MSFLLSWLNDGHLYKYDKKRAQNPIDANLWLSVRTFYQNKEPVIAKVLKSPDTNAAFRGNQYDIIKYVQQFTTNNDKDFFPVDSKGEARLLDSTLTSITPKTIFNNIIALGELFHQCEPSIQLSFEQLLRDKIKHSNIKNDQTSMVLKMFNKSITYDFSLLKTSLNTTDVYTMTNTGNYVDISLNMAPEVS